MEPLHLKYNFNTDKLQSTQWNTYWKTPPIKDSKPDPPIYWQDSQDPYELCSNFDPLDLHTTELRQTKMAQNKEIRSSKPMFMDDGAKITPEEEMKISHKKWLESLRYNFTLGADHSHLTLPWDN
ncbi:hypothetical protein GOBAR_DD14898 [Gossypium barbadense]|nr:hypothetical protein GOBAR_DD14898 [Gossypium barbadense]